MAELALAGLGAIGKGILGKVGEYLVDPILQEFKCMCCFNSNIKELETQLEVLETTKQGVELKVDDAHRNVRVIGPNVVAWQTSANNFTTEAREIIQDKARVKERCLNGRCPNVMLRYSLSKKAVKKTEIAARLKAEGAFYTESSYSPPPGCLETIPDKDFIEFESRRVNMEEIITSLKDNETNLIGICGMGGVGKTKLVQVVRERAKKQNLFDEVALVAVGQYPDLAMVQNCIADSFGLQDFKKHDDVTTRARLLAKRLLQEDKRTLLILDDVWESFGLEERGIPLECAHGTFRLLYTSRTRGIWHNVQNRKEIRLGVLSEVEAWQLFRKKAGDDLVDSSDLQPIAKRIVNECGGLPLALVVIGSALAERSNEHFIKYTWEDMCNKLTCRNSTPADTPLSSSLELSYNCLKDEDAKSLFLLCCLFQEDESISIENLVRYAFGLSLFKGVKEMIKVRARVFSLVDYLNRRHLLLDGGNDELNYHLEGHDEFVKVHDLVRDMGISIAAKEGRALVIYRDTSEWPMEDMNEHCTSISLIGKEIAELPKGLTCPNLKFLILRCKKLEKLLPNFFEGMEKLKVLEIHDFCGILTLPSLRNLTTLSLEGFCGKFDKISLIGDLLNIEILNFRYSNIEEIPEEIRKLVKLKLLDLRSASLTRIKPDILSHLVNLEELHFHLWEFIDWAGEAEEETKERWNANLREFESLNKLSTLEILIRAEVLIPIEPIFHNLTKYKVLICDTYSRARDWLPEDDLFYDSDYSKCERVLRLEGSNPLNRGGIDSLLHSCDWLTLKGKGCNDLVQLLFQHGLTGLEKKKFLQIQGCDTSECLLQPLPAHCPADFPNLKGLILSKLPNFRAIYCGPVIDCSFRELTSIRVEDCESLENLFQLVVVQKDQREDVHVSTSNIIVFSKLKTLTLEKLPSLVGFCRGIDKVQFPRLEYLGLEYLGQIKQLFHDDRSMSSDSEQNEDVGFLSLFHRERKKEKGKEILYG